MYRDKRKYGQDPEKCVRSKTKFNDPLGWREPHSIFTCSWSDWFIKDADPWRAEAWEIVRRTPHHWYLILTKRIERARECLPDDWPLPNVALGVSVENEKYVGRVAELLNLQAALHFVSYEPALGPADFSPYLSPLCECESPEAVEFGYDDHDEACPAGGPRLGWLIIGGESGPERRPMELSWARQVIKDCAAARMPCFVKQDAALKPGQQGRFTDEEWALKQFPRVRSSTQG
jgi:protein gp37